MKSFFSNAALGFVTGAAAIGISAFALPELKGTDTRALTYEQLDLFTEVLARAKADYVEEIDEVAVIDAAIDGMLGSLDPHSSYLSADDFEAMQVSTSGQYGGLGIEVTMEDGFVKVVTPMDDSPASRAGLLPGDLFTSIDGKSIFGLKLDEAVSNMRGEAGTDLSVTVLREGQDPFELVLTREVIKPKSATWRLVDDNILYFRVSTFNERTTELLEIAITEAKEAVGDRPVGLILDLRNNGGGLLDQAISVSDLFLSGGEVVSTIGRRPQDIARFNASRSVVFRDVPIVVLINAGSASASEIVAGALQDRSRATLIGMTSFGKGSVQTVVPLGVGRGAIRLTTARYYTPSGRSIQGTGISPDVEVSSVRLTEEQIARIGRYSEANLMNALGNENGTDRDVPHLPDEQPPLDYEGNDYQLDKAIEYIKAERALAGYRPHNG